MTTTSRLGVAVGLSARRRKLELFWLGLAALTIDLDAAVVDVTLPPLVRALGASTRPLQGIVGRSPLAVAAVFLAVVPVAAVVAVMTELWVPASRDPNAPRLDFLGLALSTAMIGTLVFTIIEAPEVGWLAARSVAGFTFAAVLLVVFVRWERR